MSKSYYVGYTIIGKAYSGGGRLRIHVKDPTHTFQMFLDIENVIRRGAIEQAHADEEAKIVIISMFPLEGEKPFDSEEVPAIA